MDLWDHWPNGGIDQVCATEFDQDANELGGSWVITISVYVLALVMISWNPMSQKSSEKEHGIFTLFDDHS